MRVPNAIGWSALSLGVYLAICRSWAGQERPPDAIYLSVVLWPALCLVLGLIWALRPRHMLATAAGAALIAAMWSFSFVDFPSEAWEHWPAALHDILDFGPFLLMPVAGFVWGARGPLVAALMMALADPALLPIRMWNSNAHVAGGWAEYPYPWFVGEIIILAVTTAIGWTGGYGGSWLRRRLSPHQSVPTAGQGPV